MMFLTNQNVQKLNVNIIFC